MSKKFFTFRLCNDISLNTGKREYLCRLAGVYEYDLNS